VIPHQGILSLMAWARKIGHGAPGERFTAINPLHFDIRCSISIAAVQRGRAVASKPRKSPIGAWVKTIATAAPA